MSVKRSPKKSEMLLRTPPTGFHGSDSALNKMSGVQMEPSHPQSSKRQKRPIGSPECKSSLEEVKDMFSELKQQQDHKFNALCESVSVIVNQNQEIQSTVEFMSSKYDELLSKMNTLQQECDSYKKRNVYLENRVEFLEKHNRNSSVEIRNIPTSSNEDKKSLSNIVAKVGSSIKMEAPLQPQHLRDIYRNKSQAIVVEFTSVTTKESILSKFRQFNKARRDQKLPQLNTEMIDLPGTPRTIYMSESLTAKGKRLFYLARENVKNNKLAAAWTSFGNIYVKKEETQTPIRIHEESDILKLTK